MAISYDTKTFKMLEQFLIDEDPTVVLNRIDPPDFMDLPDPSYQYINLVTLDFAERTCISQALDHHELDRFSYLDPIAINIRHTEFGAGCLAYPLFHAYSAKIGKDVILHSRSSLAEDVEIGDGCFLSGMVTVAGSVRIGKRCFISTGVTILDNVSIADDVHLLPGMTIKKDIIKPGKYYNPNVFEVREFRQFGSRDE